jgi:Fe-S oxidoreductase/nitrate reductase gamma subunit
MTINGAIFIVVLVIALAIFAYAVTRRVQNVMIGRPEWRFDRPVTRTLGFAGLVFGQRKLFKERVGVIHFFIFWGFIVIAFGTLQILAEGIHPGFTFPWAGNSGFMFAKDVLSLIVLLGLVVLAYIRYVVRKTRLEPSPEAAIILGLIFLLILSEFFYSGVAWALDYTPARDGAFVASAIGGWVAGASTGALEATRTILWWIHIVLLLSFLIYIPISKHMHLLMCPVNEWFRNLKPRGAQIVALDLENEDIEEFGVSKVQGFTTKQLMDVYACAECGRCQDHCPAYQSGKTLSPKLVMTKLKEYLDETGAQTRAMQGMLAKGLEVKTHEKALIGDVFSQDEIWACTTCYSCQEQCPVQNEHINKIIDMRRSLVLDLGEFPAEAQLACRNIERNSNPWGVGNQNRANWAKDLDVPVAGKDGVGEYLYWVGCAGSFDDRNQKVSKAIVKLLQAAGVSFSILGKDEKCCGDPARRIGNEYLFQSLAAENIETMNALGVKKIITQCPHCLNTIKNEYPGFGGDYEVIHHTQLFADLLKQGKLQLSDGTSAAEDGGAAVLAATARVAYHDSCYLGRYQQEYAAPRQVLKAVAGVTVVEADRHKNKSVCCGGGGGRMWMEEEPEHRVNEMRVGQLLEKQPEIIGVNCPYCLTMMEDGIGTKGKSETVKALDLAEILVARLKSAPTAVPAAAPEPAAAAPAPSAAPQTAQTVAATDTEVSPPAATTDTSKTEVTESEEEH